MEKRYVIAGAALLAIAATTGVLVWFSLPLDNLENASSRSWRSANVDPSRLTATLCAPSDCVLVQAGGFSFLFGAGKQAAGGLEHAGASLDRLDAVLLTGTGFASIAGLAAVRQITWMEGRSAPLPLVGPEGTERIASGINAMLEAHDAQTVLESTTLSFASAPLIAQTVRTISQRVVFDSGLVRITAYDGDGPSSHLLYRIDFSRQALLIAGCGITPDVWIRAAQADALVAIAAVDDTRRDACPSLRDLTDSLAGAGLSRAYVWSRTETDATPDETHALRGIRIFPADAGTRLDLDIR